MFRLTVDLPPYCSIFFIHLENIVFESLGENNFFFSFQTWNVLDLLLKLMVYMILTHDFFTAYERERERYMHKHL